MRKWLQTYFEFSKREYNGLLVLIVMLLLVSLVPYIYQWCVPEKTDLAQEFAAVDQLILVEKQHRSHQYEPSKRKKEHRLFKFNPNVATSEDWQLLGLSAKQAAVLMRYRAKGGRFRKKSDLQKMYPINQLMYERLLPYILLPDTDGFPSDKASVAALVKYAPHTLKGTNHIIDLNTADTVALLAVKGIGPTFARRIFKYRMRLGGYYKKEQLMEIFGLDSIKFSEIKDQLSVSASSLRLIYINKVEFDVLKDHPYLNFKQVNAILQYRKQHGNYINFAELKNVAILPVETVDKLAPYISFDHD